jgi:hypothetical protein
MNDGFWINYRGNTKVVPIHEHETDIRNPAIWKKLGFNVKDMELFKPFKLGRDREKFLLWLMQKYPLMRVRGHGVSTTFDFNNRSRQAPIDAIFEFGENNLGPFSRLYINNYATRENVEMSFSEFESLMNTDGAEGILRVGSDIRVNSRVLRELRRIATEIDMTTIFRK